MTPEEGGEMHDVRFVRPERRHLEAVASAMRDECAMECRACGHEPIDALADGVAESDLAYVCLVDGEPAFVFGGWVDAYGDCGRIWGLSSRSCDRYPRLVLEYGRKVAEVFLGWCPRWVAWSFGKCRKSQRFMRKIGFTLGRPEPCGLGSGVFVKGVLERRG